MSFVVSALDSFSIRRFDETKGRRAHLIEPVGQKLDVVLVLERKIFLVRARNSVSSCAFDVMAIHIDRHIAKVFGSLDWPEIVLETVFKIRKGYDAAEKISHTKSVSR
jgi:hypothetical protein